MEGTPAVVASSPRAQPLPSTIRVAEQKLDSLLAQSGELLVARQRIEARPRDLSPLIDSLSTWETRWKSVLGPIRQLVLQERAGLVMKRSRRLQEQLGRVVEENGDRISELKEELDRLSQNLRQDLRELKLASTSLLDDIHRIRLLPFAEACAGLERAVRDVCRMTGKEVTLLIEGGDIEVDRGVLEGLSDPLLHLVRNAVDHGIESAEERRQNSKPEKATIRVSAAVRGAEVDVIVSDDGRGLNYEKIRQRVRNQGLSEPSNDRDLAQFIFLPGLSTAEIVTDVSGRGVGMDVVKNHIESLHGRIEIASEPGLGTRFTLSLPLTLTTISALFVRCGEQTLALPTSSVSRLVRFSPKVLKHRQGAIVLPLGDVPIRTVSLSDLLEIPTVDEEKEVLTGVLTQAGDHQMVFIVDEVLSEQEAVVKTLGSRIRNVLHLSGAITLRSGQLALLLNTVNLMRQVVSSSGASSTRSLAVQLTEQTPDVESAPAHRVLVVDDSMTTRTLLKSILETAGYFVRAASDGQEAWDRLQTESFDAVVSDVDMPRMTGFQLTEKIRGSSERSRLPVILVTSRDSDGRHSARC